MRIMMMTERQQGKKKKSLSCILEDSRVNDPSFVFVHSVPTPLGWIRSAASCTSLVSPRTLPSSYRFPIPICQESLLHRLLPFCPSSGDLLSISKILGLWPTHWGCVWVSTVLPLMLLPVQGGSARSGKELIDMNAELETTHFKHHLTSEAHRRGSYSDSNNVYTSICKCLRTSHSLPFTRSALWRSAFSVTT